jgi:AcrR family transcriptional regulator
MTTRPFHHGSLRSVLLEQAEVMLRESGVDGLSLRELARQAGVSHGAPRSHFIDRQALLDALAVQGFERLTEKVTAAIHRPGTLTQRFRHVGHAYVDFAVEDAALMELMFAAKMASTSESLQQTSARLFQVLDDAIGKDSPDGRGVPLANDSAHADHSPRAHDDDARTRFKLLFAATMQGTATLIASRRISRSQGDVIVDDAIDLLLGSELGARVVTQR